MSALTFCWSLKISVSVWVFWEAEVEMELGLQIFIGGDAYKELRGKRAGGGWEISVKGEEKEGTVKMKKGETALLLLPPALLSPTTASHWPNPSRHQLTRKRGRCSLQGSAPAIQSRTEKGQGNLV